MAKQKNISEKKWQKKKKYIYIYIYKEKIQYQGINYMPKQ